jgi:hypothetical protein
VWDEVKVFKLARVRPHLLTLGSNGIVQRAAQDALVLSQLTSLTSRKAVAISQPNANGPVLCGADFVQSLLQQGHDCRPSRHLVHLLFPHLPKL